MDDGRYDNLPYGWDEEAFEMYWGDDDFQEEDGEEASSYQQRLIRELDEDRRIARCRFVSVG